MDKKLPDNITIKGLRRLREAYKDFLGSKVAVSVKLDLWDHIGANIEENIDIWWADCEAHVYFQSMKEAYEHLNKLKKEKADVNSDNRKATQAS